MFDELVEMNNTDMRLIKKAFEVAKNSQYKFRHGAVLAKSGKELRSGCNQNRPVRFLNKYHFSGGASLHAEVRVLLNITKETTNGADIYVARISGDNNMVMSRPCSMCLHMASEMGIRRIFYTIDNRNFGMIKL